MQAKVKKVIVICILTMLVFGFIAKVLSSYQNKAKDELVVFLRVDCFMDGEIVTENGILTREALSVIKKEFGDWRDQRKQELWDRYRYYDYWLSVGKTLVAVALFIIIFLCLREVFSRIYISEKIYTKFRQKEEKEDKKE
jgi:hypothetical protein